VSKESQYWDCLDQAMEAREGGRSEEALAWVAEAMKANPRGAEPHNLRGEILWDEGRVEDALGEFDQAVEVSPDLYAAHLNRIELLIEEFDEFEQAIELADDLLDRALEKADEAEVYYLKAKALFYLEDLDGAMFLLRRAVRTNGEAEVYRSFEGQLLFEMGRYEEAEQALLRARALEPNYAHAVYHLALVNEALGRSRAADALFAEAARLNPDAYPVPVRMDPGEVEAAANEALRTLPGKLRRYVRNVPILLEDLPDVETVRRDNVSPLVLGLFIGEPLSQRDGAPWSTAQVVEPTRIVLYKRNLERVAQSREQLVEEIQTTVKHEIGHYFDLDEAELQRLGLG
jgi:tetratricopeptide (TPR) repeat protein